MLQQFGHTGSGVMRAIALALSLATAACSWQQAEVRSGPAESPQEILSRQPANSQTIGERAAAIALRQVGTPYRYGGQTPAGFDCSGLVHYAYGRAGVTVPRTTDDLWSTARPVLREELRPGDVLFFSIAGKMQHVGLYVGEGRFAHAPSSGRSVTVESLAAGFYREAFLRGGRLQ